MRCIASMKTASPELSMYVTPVKSTRTRSVFFAIIGSNDCLSCGEPCMSISPVMDNVSGSMVEIDAIGAGIYHKRRRSAITKRRDHGDCLSHNWPKTLETTIH